MCIFFVLRIELVGNDDGSVTMCQRRFVDDVLKRFGMDDCKAVASPVDMSSRLVSSDATTKLDAPFREAVGALMHLTTATRPDIAFAVGYVSRFMENNNGLQLWWSGIRKIADAIPTLHWRPDDRLTEGVPRFRVLCLLSHLVYPSVGRVALFLVDLS